MKNYGIKRTIAAVMSLAIVGGALPGTAGSIITMMEPVTASADNAQEPILTFNHSSGLLILDGYISDASVLASYATDSRVKHVYAKATTVFGDCENMFSGTNENGEAVYWQTLQTADLSYITFPDTTSMGEMFRDLPNLLSVDLSYSKTPSLTNMSFMFYNCPKLESVDFTKTNTNGVTNARYMFNKCTSLTSTDDVLFNTSGLQIADSMFGNCTALETADFRKSDTSNVSDASQLFENCSSLTTVHLGDFGITDVFADEMFINCSSLRLITIRRSEQYFRGDSVFDGCVSLVGGNGTAYSSDHTGSDLARQDIPGNPGYFTSDCCYLEDDGTLILTGMIRKDQIENEIINDTEMNSKVKRIVAAEGTILPSNTYSLFSKLGEVTEINLSQADFTLVNCFGSWFSDCPNLVSVDITGLHHDRVIKSAKAFSGCSNLKTIYVAGDANLRNYSLHGFNSDSMFAGCTSLVGGSGTVFDPNYIEDDYAHVDGGTENPGYFTEKCCSFNETTGKLTIFGNVSYEKVREYAGDERVNYVYAAPGAVLPELCYGCENGSEVGLFEDFRALTIDLSKADTSNVRGTINMFKNCSTVFLINLNDWDTRSLSNTRSMFDGCSVLYQLGLASFDTSNVTNMSYMFASCKNLKGICVSELWSTERVSLSDGMFYDCQSIIGGNGTAYDPDAVSADMAVIDGRDGKPGYLSNLYELNIAFKHNCSFDSDLSMFYAVPKDALAGYSNIRLTINKEVYDPGETVPHTESKTLTAYTEKTISDVDYYVFSFSGIAATDMGSVLNATLSAEKNGRIYATTTDSYSIREYALDRLENSTNDSFKKMMVDMLNYGAAAQVHFGKNTANLVNSDLTAEQLALGTQTLPELNNNENIIPLDGAAVQFGKKNIAFQNKTELMLQMKFPEDMDMSKVKLNVNYVTSSGTQVTKKISASKFTKNGEYYIANFNTLAIPDLRSVISFKIMNGKKQISDTLQYSVESYVYNRLSNSDSVTYKALITELMKFGISAEEHFS